MIRWRYEGARYWPGINANWTTFAVMLPLRTCYLVLYLRIRPWWLWRYIGVLDAKAWYIPK